MNDTTSGLLVMTAYGVTGALMMAIALGILIKIWDYLTPVDEWKEIGENNIAVAIVTASVILAFGYVIGNAIS